MHTADPKAEPGTAIRHTDLLTQLRTTQALQDARHLRAHLTD